MSKNVAENTAMKKCCVMSDHVILNMHKRVSKIVLRNVFFIRGEFSLRKNEVYIFGIQFFGQVGFQIDNHLMPL